MAKICRAAGLAGAAGVAASTAAASAPTLRVIAYALFFRRLRRKFPELFDGAAASVSVSKALAEDGYT